MPNKTKRVKTTLDKMTAVRLEDKEYGRLMEIGLELDRPASWVIRQAVKEYIERYKPGKA